MILLFELESTVAIALAGAIVTPVVFRIAIVIRGCLKAAPEERNRP